MAKRIAIVEDEAAIRENYAAAFRREGYLVDDYEARQPALEAFESRLPDLVVIDINLKAYFFAAQAVIPGMQKLGGGSIVNFSSISYMMGNAGYPVYTTANSGINGLTRSLAREFGPDRIRVNALAPGWVLT